MTFKELAPGSRFILTRHAIEFLSNKHPVQVFIKLETQVIQKRFTGLSEIVNNIDEAITERGGKLFGIFTGKDEVIQLEN